MIASYASGQKNSIWRSKKLFDVLRYIGIIVPKNSTRSLRRIHPTESINHPIRRCCRDLDEKFSVGVVEFFEDNTILVDVLAPAAAGSPVSQSFAQGHAVHFDQ